MAADANAAIMAFGNALKAGTQAQQLRPLGLKSVDWSAAAAEAERKRDAAMRGRRP